MKAGQEQATISQRGQSDQRRVVSQSDPVILPAELSVGIGGARVANLPVRQIQIKALSTGNAVGVGALDDFAIVFPAAGRRSVSLTDAVSHFTEGSDGWFVAGDGFGGRTD